MRAELRRCILSVAGIPDMRFEELPPRDPIVGVPFIVDKLEKGEPSMGATDLVREDGIYHANLWWPRAQAKDGEDLADKIRLQGFWVGRELIAGQGSGRVLTNAIRDSFPPRDGWLTFPIRASFFFYRPAMQGRFG